ncbi:type IX secretion system membrane protein PorP/SprF [uncultured Cytophaga sp.]|uniref:PorP/SprF family type IX secretion system membrane protein n=1 Tax=uncultured Cytophaga sp. TaxID=160238 RepID=UPI00262073FC|nr:type IX secretion system membrane protein PorP/SprF [uncultured Cytophaga sp.]
MVKKIACSVYITFFSLFLTTLGQDAVFSQYYASSLYLNPALAAAEPTVSLSMNSRVQWKSIISPYTTNQASLIVPIYRSSDKSINLGGLGVSVFQNKAGEIGLTNTGANFTASYIIPFNEKNHLLAGVQVGVMQKTIDFSKGQWGSQFDVTNGFDSNISSGEYNFVSSKMYLDINFGAVYYNNPRRDIRELGKSFYVGYSAYHFNRPNESVIANQKSNLPVLNKFILGGEYSLSSSINISPNLLVALQNASSQINVGLYGTYSFGDADGNSLLPSKLYAGAWYRLKDSFIGSIGFGGKFYSIGISYDMNSSTLRKNATSKGAGAYEISLKITSPKIEKVHKVYQTPRI